VWELHLLLELVVGKKHRNGNGSYATLATSIALLFSFKGTSHFFAGGLGFVNACIIYIAISSDLRRILIATGLSA
jgi:hypothetical protein